jgi:hypothetical protein
VVLAWAEVGRRLLPLLWKVRLFSPQHRQSFGTRFLIVCMEYSYEVLVRDNSYYKLFRKLSLNLIGVSMSDWRFVEHKGSVVSCFREQ